MAKPVVLSKRALRQISAEMEYQRQNWSELAAAKLWEAVLHKMALISENPEMYAETRFEGIRRCNVTSYIAIYYSVRPSQVSVLRFYGTAQDPQNLKF